MGIKSSNRKEKYLGIPMASGRDRKIAAEEIIDKVKQRLQGWKMNTLAVFGSCKSIFEKYSIFRKCYFPERKIFSCVWLHFKKFFEKYFLVFREEEGKDKPRRRMARSHRDCRDRD